MTLVEFLLARISEDEETAKLAAFGWGATWSVETDHYEEWSTIHADGKRDMVGCADGDVTRHIARHDPARVSAECDVKRKIISTIPFPTPHFFDDLHEWESCSKALTEPLGDLPWGPDAECTCGADRVNAQGGPLILRLLAVPYVNHPDYQEEWKP